MKRLIDRRHWKIFLFIIAIAIGFTSLYITNSLVEELAKEEQKKIELWAEAMRQLSAASNLEDSLQSYALNLQIIQSNTTVPVILTDTEGAIVSHINISPRWLNKDNGIERLLEHMKKSKEPIVANLMDGEKNYVYFTDSITLVRLTYYPYIQLTVIMLFILVSYFAFSYSRRVEQDRVWVGMAKETAHQLGTPTSSLLAWVELLKDSSLEPAFVENFEKDVQRLDKIVDRFSKIGSTPVLTPTNLTAVVDETISYLQSRLSAKIDIIKGYDSQMPVELPLNETLFEWVLENLIKNAVDAISGSGTVAISITDSTQVVFIDVRDSGKGIVRGNYKTIFRPGYTTKNRGWGLGLSLSKRIIEENHNGKLFVSQSEVDKGTTIRIVLDKRIS